MVDPNPFLDAVEVRILGALIEKELTTPEYYPLSLNAMTTACNQSTNRHPVTHFDEPTVDQGLERLRQKSLIHVVHKADSRVIRYRHVARETLKIDAPEAAALCVLLLRGPQTVGEIRTRSNRMHDFENLEAVESVLQRLISRPEPLVVRLPRQPGQKEIRYAHVLSGHSDLDESPPSPETGEDRVSRLEATAEELRRDLNELREQFDRLRKQFE